MCILENGEIEIMDLAIIAAKQVLEMFLMILAGFICFKTGVIKEEGKKALSDLLLYLVVPAMIVNSYLVEHDSSMTGNLVRMLIYSILMVGTGLVITYAVLFSKKNKEVFSAPLGIDNPVTVQVLGICSALAVTAKLEPAIVMGLSVTVITAFANVVISLLRKTIPNRIRIIVQLVVVAALVTIVSEILKAFAYDVSVQLSVYVGLIITNCILMGRLEAFAMQNGPWESFLDGVGNGLGYAKILIIVAFFRELFGSGTLLGFNILNYEPIQNIGYVNNGLMLMPPMALIIVACIIWYQRARHKELQEQSN